MSRLRELKTRILEEGVDMRIDEADWLRIRDLLPEDGAPSFGDLQVLVELRTEARSVCPAFDAYFFPIFKTALLADGRISTSEHFQLLRLLYGGGGVDAAERRFLHELRQELRERSPEFEVMFQQAMRD
jgi:hypothetical protein